jgi:hypothetical protein
MFLVESGGENISPRCRRCLMFLVESGGENISFLWPNHLVQNFIAYYDLILDLL